MKTKTQQLECLRLIQRQIVAYLIKDSVDKEGHIPVWQLRMWGSNVKSAGDFLQRQLRKDKENAAKKRRKV